MLFQLLPPTSSTDVLDRLGYPHDRRTIPRTIEYYRPTTRVDAVQGGPLLGAGPR